MSDRTRTETATTGTTTTGTTTGPAAKDPDEWATGDEPITGPQLSYLETLLQQAGRERPDDLASLSKAEASKRIDELQAVTGRGR
jgi:hypothetical protein